MVPLHRHLLKARHHPHLTPQRLERDTFPVLQLIAPLQPRLHAQRTDLPHRAHLLHPPRLIEPEPVRQRRAEVPRVPGAVRAQPDMQRGEGRQMLLHPGEEGLPGDEEVAVHARGRERAVVPVRMPQGARRHPAVQVDVQPELEVADAAVDGGRERGEEGETARGRGVQPDAVTAKN
ncbi:hypothetical protein BO86DRAFT_387500 [Aspergillus japonicus CBS 114.51]|uniref:Uncharacterized protein n=1 Tax=Aspergillus japonicus CBS 114.51 TaxID=1448312 RepID=A0A8T8X6J8_ASPJA|nr:hypothetical protein BO86DRAFT_387500 [Aspergillus japonicus CBS 114.51]RAH83665.1 hypothetical protein BO86DRAFT_387500 [Aspergillus japonicus CBS 114.51]